MAALQKKASCQITIIARFKSIHEKQTPEANLVAGNASIKTENKNFKNHFPSMHCI